MFSWFFKLFKKEELKNEDLSKRDNLEKAPVAPVQLKPVSAAKELWCPKAFSYGDKMKTRGFYEKGYPVGAVIHFTAGRARKAPEGGGRALATHKLMGEKSVKSCIEDQSYAYFVNDMDGGIHQAFPLSKWAYHAGESYWEGLGNSLSSKLVGIENQSAGKLEKVKDGVYKAYFTTPSKGDNYFYEHEVRHITKKIDHRQVGTYHKFSEAQEKSLIELLLWLKANNPDVFNFDYVLSHCEIAPKRKNDVGGALSMSMPEFRELLKAEYKKRHG